MKQPRINRRQFFKFSAFGAGLLALPTFALADVRAAQCRPGSLPKGDTCISARQAAQDIVALARQMMKDADLKAVILRITVGDQNVVTTALGDSMTGVPATTAMHFRNGSVAISYLTTLLLQLDDEGQLSLDDALSKWLPDLPHSGQVTLRMLANCTSGYADYVPNAAFTKAQYGDVFKHWTQQELIDIAMAESLACPPGTCFHYSHINFVLLGQVFKKVTGQPVEDLIHSRILRPLGLRNTRSDMTAVIHAPVLHAFSRERGMYEESTYWNPSWTLAEGAIMTSDIFDMARSMRAIGQGRLVSRKAHAEQLAPLTASFAPWTPERYYGLGIFNINGWLLQNPSFFGYAAVGAYLPSHDIIIAISSTKGPTADIDTNDSYKLFEQIETYLALNTQ